MMRCVEFTEKEIVIFNGLIDLIRNGANPYSIKVSDIAKAANIGKGTIYDYFSSKEEAISKALLYSINNELESAHLRIQSRDNFKDMFFEVLTIIEENMQNNLSTINLLLSSGGVHKFYEHLQTEKHDLSNCIKVIDNLVRKLLTVGYKEGIINTKEDHYYQTMAVRGAVASYSGYLSARELFPDKTREDAMESIYRMLVKALN